MLAYRPESFIFEDDSKVWNIGWLVVSWQNHRGQAILYVLGELYGGEVLWS